MQKVEVALLCVCLLLSHPDHEWAKLYIKTTATTERKVKMKEESIVKWNDFATADQRSVDSQMGFVSRQISHYTELTSHQMPGPPYARGMGVLVIYWYISLSQ